MFRMRNFLSLGLAALIGAVISASPADADFKVRYSTDGGKTFQEASDSGSGEITFAIDKSLKVRGVITTSSGYIDPSGSYLDLQLQGQGNVGTTYNLVVLASMNYVNTAPSPQSLTTDFASTSSVTTSGITGGGFTNQTWINNSNSLFDTSNSYAITTGVLSIPTTGDVGFQGYFQGVVPYSITTKMTATFKQTATSQSLGLDSNSGIAPAPAPTGIVLVATALPLLGVGGWFRRKKVSTHIAT
jgi:hypothetical protein